MESEEKLDEDGLTVEERKIVEEKRAKHKRVAFFKFDDYGLVVLRPPTGKEVGRVQEAVNDPRHDGALAGVNYVRDAIVHPADALRVQSIIEDYPVWVQGPAGRALNELGGAGVNQLNKSTRKGSA